MRNEKMVIIGFQAEDHERPSTSGTHFTGNQMLCLASVSRSEPGLVNCYGPEAAGRFIVHDYLVSQVKPALTRKAQYKHATSKALKDSERLL
jgi:hypothetical protein